MKWVRMFLFIGLVAATLLFATGGRLQLGIIWAIGLATLIGLMEPSIAK